MNHDPTNHPAPNRAADRQNGGIAGIKRLAGRILRAALWLPAKINRLRCRIEEHGLRLTMEYILKRLGDAFGIGEQKCLRLLPGLNKAQRHPRILVSLSAGVPEMASLGRTIKSLLRQTVRPDHLILHLDSRDFPQGARDLPRLVTRLLLFGIEIRPCGQEPADGELLALFAEEPDAIILTVHSGFLYRAEMIEWLYTAYRRNPNMIHCQRAMKIRQGVRAADASTGAHDRIPSYLNMPCIGAGCLFPPRTLSRTTIERARVFSFAQRDEDLQIWLLALANDVKVNVVDLPLLRLPPARRMREQTRAKNTQERQNAPVDLADVIAAFPEWGQRLLSEQIQMEYLERAISVPQKQKGYDYYRALTPQMYRAELCLWYQKVTHQRLDLDHPETFNEKIQWMKLYDSTLLKALLSDKYGVRDWVAERVGRDYLVPLLGVWDTFDEIDFSALPERFVLKATHGCGWNILVPDKRRFDREQARSRMNQWLATNFAFQNGLELNYKAARPRIIAEEYLENAGGDLYDYKFWCFEGRVHYIMFLSERKNGLKMAFFSRDWERVDLSYEYPRNKKQIQKPPQIDHMIELSERLSAGFQHCRVDFYLLDNGEIRFGELTFSSASGSPLWDPPEADRMLGGLFTLPAASPTP